VRLSIQPEETWPRLPKRPTKSGLFTASPRHSLPWPFNWVGSRVHINQEPCQEPIQLRKTSKLWFLKVAVLFRFTMTRSDTLSPHREIDCSIRQAREGGAQHEGHHMTVMSAPQAYV
jgi:hypothetical protein